MIDIKEMSGEELIIKYGKCIGGLVYYTTHSDEYAHCLKDADVILLELKSRLEAGEKAIAAMKQIGDLVYNCSCHADTSNEVTKIFMEYEK